MVHKENWKKKMNPKTLKIILENAMTAIATTTTAITKEQWYLSNQRWNFIIMWLIKKAKGIFNWKKQKPNQKSYILQIPKQAKRNSSNTAKMKKICLMIHPFACLKDGK